MGIPEVGKSRPGVWRQDEPALDAVRRVRVAGDDVGIDGRERDLRRRSEGPRRGRERPCPVMGESQVARHMNDADLIDLVVAELPLVELRLVVTDRPRGRLERSLRIDVRCI